MKKQNLVAKFNEKLLKIIEPNYILLLVFSLLIMASMLIYTWNKYGFEGSYTFEALVLLLGIGILFLLRHRISINLNVSILVTTLFMYGIYIFTRTSYGGTGIYMILIGLIGSHIFLRERHTNLLLIIFGFFLLNDYRIAASLNDVVSMTYYENALYNIIAILVLIVIAYVSIYQLKKYIIISTMTLDGKMAELELDNIDNKELRQLAFYNTVTGLTKFEYFYKKLSHNYNRESYLLIFDVVDFAQVNSYHNILKGNMVLSEIGACIVSKSTSQLNSTYIGSNTFGLIIDDVWSYEKCKVLKEEINESLNLQRDLDFYFSIIPLINKNSYEGLQKDIDRSLTLIKSNSDSFSRYIVYSDDIDKQINENEEIKNKIEKAINERTFDVYFQGQVKTLTEELVGVESLARLTLDGEIISPYKFVKIIEDNSMEIAFGEMIIELVLSSYNDIKVKYGSDISVAINISPYHLLNDNFMPHLEKHLTQNKVLASKIEIEITENVLIDNIEKAKIRIKQLRSVGVKVAIDDFGTGYSSLSYIHSLEIDVLKIDMSFIRQIVDDNKSKSIVHAIINMAHEGELTVVAEGVEFDEQRKILKEMHCDIIQGYLYSKPSPLH